MGTFYYKWFWLIIIGLQNSADANFLQRAFHFYSLLSCHGSCMSVAFEDWKRFYCSSWFYMAPFHPIPCCTILSHPIQPHPTIAWHGFIYRQHPVWISGLSPHSDQLTEIESFYQDYQQKKHILISFGCSLFIRSSWLEMHSRHHKCNPDVNLTASRCHSGHRWPQCTGSKKRWPQSAEVSYFPTSNHSWPARKNADWWQWSNHKQWCTDRDPIKSSIFKSKCQHLECLPRHVFPIWNIS